MQCVEACGQMVAFYIKMVAFVEINNPSVEPDCVFSKTVWFECDLYMMSIASGKVL